MHGQTANGVGARVPHADHPTGPPRRAGLFNEIGILREPLRLAARTPSLARAPRGDGRLTITIPGWYAPESSLAPIRSFLGRTGHDARSWGLGIIRNDVEAARDRFIEQLDRQVAASGRSAHLVGWSLGGVIARETARLRPELVHRVVTFGTPAIGGPTYTAGADRMGAEECRRIEQLQTELDESNPIGTPITAVYTRRDGVVDWRACIDRYSTNVEHIEVGSTHVGLGVDPDVWQITARALSERRSGAAARGSSARRSRTDSEGPTRPSATEDTRARPRRSTRSR